MKIKHVLLSGATGVENGTPVNVENLDKGVFMLHTTGSTAGTVKFVVGFDDYPDLAEAKTIDNDFHFAEVVNVDTGDIIDGSTGIVMAGTAVNAAYQLNVDGAKWIAAITTALTVGTVNVNFSEMNNNFM